MSFTYSLEHVNHPHTHPEGLSDSSSVLLLGFTQEALQDSFHMAIVPPPPIPLDKTTTISMHKILLTPLPTDGFERQISHIQLYRSLSFTEKKSFLI